MASSVKSPAIVQLIKDPTRTFPAPISQEEEEEALFRTTIVAEHLLREVKVSDSQHEDASIACKVSSGLLPFIAGIEQYRQALDVVTNSNNLPYLI